MRPSLKRSLHHASFFLKKLQIISNSLFLSRPQKKLCASIPVFKRLPKQNAFLFKKSLAMGC